MSLPKGIVPMEFALLLWRRFESAGWGKRRSCSFLPRLRLSSRVSKTTSSFIRTGPFCGLLKSWLFGGWCNDEDLDLSWKAVVQHLHSVHLEVLLFVEQLWVCTRDFQRVGDLDDSGIRKSWCVRAAQIPDVARPAARWLHQFRWLATPHLRWPFQSEYGAGAAARWFAYEEPRTDVLCSAVDRAAFRPWMRLPTCWPRRRSSLPPRRWPCGRNSEAFTCTTSTAGPRRTWAHCLTAWRALGDKSNKAAPAAWVSACACEFRDDSVLAFQNGSTCGCECLLC